MSKQSDPITCGDCVVGMRRMAAAQMDLVFADPPFNIGYKYDVYDDKKSYDDYLAWSASWMSHVYRVVKPTGSFWLAIGDSFVSELDVLAKQLGFHKRSQVCWYYTFGVNSVKKFTPSHTQLLYYTKHKTQWTFNTAELKVPSARQLVYNDKRAKDGGRLPDDTWILRPQWLPDAFCSGEDTWSVSRVAGTFKERAGTPNQMPERLLARIIRACSNVDDIVFDPFAGSATSLTTAKKLGRRYLGWELSKEYAAGGNARLDSCRVGDELDGAVQQGDRDVG